MKIINGLQSVRDSYPKLAATLGVFDGVHRGHRKIIKAVVNTARRLGGKSMVLTFDFHPMKVICPSLCPPYLTTLDEKLCLFESLGVDIAVVIRFDRAFSSLPAESFVKKILVEKLCVSSFIVGSDYRFGFKAKGDIALLKSMGKANGFTVKQVAPAQYQGKVVSSTWIRKLIQTGELRTARLLLGHDYSLSGKVVHGVHRGRKLGFPTANFYPKIEQVIPAAGVYALYILAGGRTFSGVGNLGFRPTFKKLKRFLLEVHLFGYKGNLYGKTLDVSFAKKLRDEKRFASVEELTKQIRLDRRRAEIFFK